VCVSYGNTHTHTHTHTHIQTHTHTRPLYRVFYGRRWLLYYYVLQRKRFVTCDGRCSRSSPGNKSLFSFLYYIVICFWNISFLSRPRVRPIDDVRCCTNCIHNDLLCRPRTARRFVRSRTFYKSMEIEGIGGGGTKRILSMRRPKDEKPCISKSKTRLLFFLYVYQYSKLL